MKDNTAPGAERLGPYTFHQTEKGLRLTEDPVLLVEFTQTPDTDTPVIDLGTGTGAIPLLLAWKTDVRSITGVEVQPADAAIAQKNVEINGLTDRIEILKRDFRGLPGTFREGSFPVVISNPPYVKAGSGRVSPEPARAAARSEQFGTMADLVDVSRYLAGERGRVFYIYPVLRLEELLGELKRTGLKPVRMRFVHTGPEKRARLVMVEARTSGELVVEEPVNI